jgi:hypothetical protein
MPPPHGHLIGFNPLSLRIAMRRCLRLRLSATQEGSRRAQSM